MPGKRKKFEVPEQKENGVRINKYLGDAGVCSRREADRLIDALEQNLETRVEELNNEEI